MLYSRPWIFVELDLWLYSRPWIFVELDLCYIVGHGYLLNSTDVT